jgi:disulfide bond formation protein DsbB
VSGLLQSRWLSGGRLLPLVALASVAAVAAALVSQHGFDMQPCPWCVLQRVIFLAIALAALGAWAWARPGWRRSGAVLTGLLAASGMAAALWQHFVGVNTASCQLTLADRIVGTLGLDRWWPEVFAAYASCADAAVDLLGVPYEFWSLALYLLFGALAGLVWRRPV